MWAAARRSDASSGSGATLCAWRWPQRGFGARARRRQSVPPRLSNADDSPWRLSAELRQYIALRCALGTRRQQPAATLERFLDSLEREKAEFITSDLALRWATRPQGVPRATWARRLGLVREFASWLSTIDPRTQVPPHRLLPSRRRPNKPQIFSPQEIGRLMKEASRLVSSTWLRALTYATLSGFSRLQASVQGRIW